jgi:hypothetical protein
VLVDRQVRWSDSPLGELQIADAIESEVRTGLGLHVDDAAGALEGIENQRSRDGGSVLEVHRHLIRCASRGQGVVDLLGNKLSRLSAAGRRGSFGEAHSCRRIGASVRKAIGALGAYYG